MIGLVTLGTSARDDLKRVYEEIMSPSITVKVAGALDHLSVEEIECLSKIPGNYPLYVRTSFGEFTIHREALIPYIVEAADKLSADGTTVNVLMCAGDFSELYTKKAFMIPSRAMEGAANSIARTKKIGVVVPIEEQAAYSKVKWENAGFEPTVITANPLKATAESIIELFEQYELEQIALDCIGFSQSLKEQLMIKTNSPVWHPLTTTAKLLTEFLLPAPVSETKH